MKNLLSLAMASALALAACSTSPDSEPVEELKHDRYLTLPSTELARRSGSSLKELHIGFGVWVRECGSCHEHVFPDDVSTKDWHVMTPKMAWNANITDAEQEALLEYILAARTDPNALANQLKSVNAVTP